jgi:exodeoxyribonuclease V alpha subunit
MTALRATGRLREFGEAGVLGVADVQVATRLGALVGERDERVLLAVALVVRGTRQGSVVLDLADAADSIAPEGENAEPVELAWPPVDEWVATCAGSVLVRPALGGAPLHLIGSRLWLDRYWRQEALVADELLARVADRPADLDADRLQADLAALFPAVEDADQRRATDIAVRSRVSVLGGGPGTGKTTTIARLITVLRRQRPDLRIALSAPTGKAAARLQEAVHAAAAPQPDRAGDAALTDEDRAALTALPAATLHRLLGARPGVSSRFRHHRENRLPYDVVIVDESSMVSLTMMARLLEAVPAAARLILVGDPDQLASVEAGAVLGDLVDAAETPLQRSVALLQTIRRFDAGGAIAELAGHVRAGRAADALALLRAGRPGIVFHPVPDDEPLAGAALDAVRRRAMGELEIVEAARAGDATTALDALDSHRLLCAHRTGPRGVRHWSDVVERWLAAADPALTTRLDGRYAGQPLLVTANDYENQLYNGDTGVIIVRDDELVAAFRRGLVPLVRLSDVRPMHAMTIHRAQGSQFDDVTVLLPAADSPLATRQTLYTAITRAAGTVTVIGAPEAVLACVDRPAARATGLRDRLAGRLA